MKQHVQKRGMAPPWWSPVDRGAHICVCFPCVCHQTGIYSCAVIAWFRWPSLYWCLYVTDFSNIGRNFLAGRNFSILLVAITWSTTAGTEEIHPIFGSRPGSKRSLHCPGNCWSVLHLQVLRTLYFWHLVYKMQFFRRVKSGSWRKRHYERKITHPMPCSSPSWILSCKRKLVVDSHTMKTWTKAWPMWLMLL